MTLPRGRVAFEGGIASPVLGAERFVRIYLPPSYQPEAPTRFPVLYLQDGQNSFSTVGDGVAYGWGNWGLDRLVDDLSAAGRMREIIMVAVDCSRERYLEYRGPAARALGGSAARNRRFENYGRFLVQELKPRIDATYRTRPDPANTGLMGASMGGLGSVALAWKYPDVFGRAASMSGAFQVERGAFRKSLRAAKNRRGLRIYLDSGVLDSDGSDDGRRDTAAVARRLMELGWTEGVDLSWHVEEHLLTEEELARSGVDRGKWPEARLTQHNELYWRRRAWRPLTFLFPPG